MASYLPAPLAAPTDLYFANRLSTLRRAPELSASMQFDLATSPLNDDQIDEVSSAWGGNAGQSGFGFSEALRDMISREPKRVPVDDISTLQNNLVNQGYAPPEAIANGTWDPQWYAYFRRWDRDNYDRVMAGHHWGAAPMEAGIRLISDTLPSVVFQNLVGAAKGLQTQAFGTDQFEGTVERLGAIGGAAAGAGIGTIIAPGVGTAIGAGIGAAVGFFGDIFGEDPEEQEQSFGASLLDALSPYEEYQEKGWREFWTDLGFIGTMASLVSGAKMAATGAKAVIGGISATAAESNVPALTAALARPAMAQPGFATKILAGASEKFVAGSGGWIKQQATRFGPFAQMQRPAFQVVNKAFTGAATAGIGARLSAGFDLGTGVVQQTAIEKAIVETDPLESGISLPILGDLVDWASFVMVPERFLPFSAGTMGRAGRRLMGDVAMWPFFHAAQQADPTLTGSAARGKIRELITPERNTYARLDYGVHTEALQLADAKGVDYATARADVIDRLHTEARELGPLATGEDIAERIARGQQPMEFGLRAELLSRSLRDPEKFAGWLVDLPGEGIGKFDAYADVSAAARRATRDVRDGRYLVTATPQGFVAGETGLEIGSIQAQGLETAALKAEGDQLDTLIKKREGELARVTDGQAHMRLSTELTTLKGRQGVVKQAIEKIEEVGPRVGEVNVIPAREDFLTRRDLYDKANEFRALRQELESTAEAGLFEAQKVAQQKMNVMLSELGGQGILPDRLVVETIEKGARPGDKVAKFLDDAASRAARDVTLSAQDMAYFAERGYKPVVTGESVLQLDEIDQIAEVFSVGDYTRRANFFESLGMSGRFVKEENQFALKVAHERSELDQMFLKNDLPINGRNALTRIHDYLKDTNRQGVAWGPLIKKTKGMPHLPYVDPRQLTPEDLNRVFENVPGFTEQHANELMGALKRGGALGAEVSFMAPFASARSLGAAMRVSGMPGFADYMRTLKFPVTPKSLSVAAGGISGAVAGGLIGDETKDIFTGAAIGAAAGLGYGVVARKSYGYLPDALSRMNMALRYTFSFTFDLGRYSEAATIAGARYSLPATFAPKRKLRNLPEGMVTPYSNGAKVKGDELWNHAIRFQDELNGTVYFHGLEDAERRVFQAGMLGFKPRDFEAYYGIELYQRGWGSEQIKEAVANINRYGVGRTVAEKSANFVFFPFSFSKKLLNSLGDFILQAPGRNLILTEGLRRYHDSALDEGFHTLIEEHLPILEQLAQVNNLVYGLSPGRFFLEGLTDHRSAAGWVSQILASILVPGGSATTFARSVGQAGDLAMNAFIPVVVTGESLDRAGGVDGLDDIIRSYVPLVREIDQYMVQSEGGVIGGAIGEQITAITSPTHQTPYAQMTGYLDGIRAWKDDMEPLALALGYTSTDGLLQSEVGAGFQMEYDKLQNDLRVKYPQGWGMVSQIDNTELINEAAMNDLARQVQDGTASRSEEQILLLQQEATFWKMMNSELGMPPDIGSAMLGSTIRTMAKRNQNDPRYQELYRRFFEREYGPIEVTFA